MADDPNVDNLLSTPPGYASPKQYDAVREYAKALMFGGIGAGAQQPVHHWTQGLSNLINGLVGDRALHNVGKNEVAAKAYEASGELPEAPGQPSAAGVRPVAPPRAIKTSFAPDMAPPPIAGPAPPQTANAGGGSIFGGMDKPMGLGFNNSDGSPDGGGGGGQALPFSGQPIGDPA